MSTTSENGIFINGKAQIIEMLQLMTAKEKERIIKHIRLKNPNLANELEEKSFSFKDLFNLRNETLKPILEAVNPAILGISLRNLSSEIQRKVLSIISRSSAEDSFTWMTKKLNDESRDIQRAQEKVMGNALVILKRIRS